MGNYFIDFVALYHLKLKVVLGSMKENSYFKNTCYTPATECGSRIKLGAFVGNMVVYLDLASWI